MNFDIYLYKPIKRQTQMMSWMKKETLIIKSSISAILGARSGVLPM
jgi:hypothetical protein